MILKMKFTRKFVGGNLDGITHEDGFKVTDREFKVWKGLEKAGHVFTGFGSPYVVKNVYAETDGE